MSHNTYLYILQMIFLTSVTVFCVAITILFIYAIYKIIRSYP